MTGESSSEEGFNRLRASDPMRRHLALQDSNRLREEIIMQLNPTNLDHRKKFHLGVLWRPAIPLLAASVAAFAIFPFGGSLETIKIPAANQSPASAAESFSAKMMWSPTEYRLAPGVEGEAGSRAVWRLRPVDADDVRALADRLGVKGSLVESSYGPTPAQVSYQIGDLFAGGGGHFSWSNTELYDSPKMKDRMAQSSCSVSSPPSSGFEPSSPRFSEPANSETSVCGEPAPLPVVLPSESASREMLSQFFPGARLSLAYTSPWSHVFTVDFEVAEGVWLSNQGSAEVSDLGVLYVSGLFTGFDPAGGYPTIPASAAMNRIMHAVSMVSRAAGVPTAGCALPPVEHSGDMGKDDSVLLPNLDPAEANVAPDAAPCGRVDSPTTTSPRVVELVSVRPDYTSLTDAEGVLWVVPSWVYLDAEGFEYTAVALDDAYYQTIPSVNPDPAHPPVDLPAPGAIPGSQGTGESTPPMEPTPPPVVEPEVESSRYVGFPLEESTRRAAADGFSVRVSMLDGVPQVGTADYRTDRLNFTVEDGLVVEVSIG